jgi:hypothetical protein
MTDETPIIKQEESCPPTWGEMVRKIFWRVFTREIEVDAGGGREVKMNVIVWLIVISSLVIAVFIFEKIGFVDDVKDMVIKHHAQTEKK